MSNLELQAIERDMKILQELLGKAQVIADQVKNQLGMVDEIDNGTRNRLRTKIEAMRSYALNVKNSFAALRRAVIEKADTCPVPKGQEGEDE